jgi:hypothetical protein
MAPPRLFNQRELDLLSQTHPDLQVGVHEVQGQRERGWELRISYQDKKNQLPQHMTLVTARGNVRTFKNLDTAVGYMKEHCAHIDIFGVYLMEPTKPKNPSKTTGAKPADKSTPTKEKKKKTEPKKTEFKKKPSPPRKKIQ